MKKVICFSALIFSLTLCFAATQSTPTANCPTPQNVTKVAASSGTISFDWEGCDGCSQTFEVYYVVNGNASTIYTTCSSGITFTGLTSGTYEFHFRTVCGSGVSSEIIIIDDVIES